MSGGTEFDMDQERQRMMTSLDRQRGHVLSILDGLSEPQLRQAVLPSGWTCLGMVKHLISVERYWFRRIVRGELPEDSLPNERSAWQVEPLESSNEVFDSYRAEIAAANQIIATTPLDSPPLRRDEWWGSWEVPDLRFIVLHVVAETACHAGHLDVVRELLDGRQWLVQ